MRTIFGVRGQTALLAIIDVVLVRAWVQDDLSSAVVIFSHMAAVVLFCALGLATRNDDRERTVGTAVFVLLLGPLGGAMLLLIELGKTVSSLTLAPAADPVAAPSRAEVLHAQILQGRRRRTDGAPPHDFTEVFASGSLKRQQAAIAAISQGYTPDMLPALKVALASEVPMLRVQAAAVFAKLRGTFGAQAKALRMAASEGPLSPDQISAAARVAASGFVDADTAADLRALGGAQSRQPAPEPTGAPPATRRRVRRVPVRPPQLKRYSCGGVA